jgi:hypothetical protein
MVEKGLGEFGQTLMEIRNPNVESRNKSKIQVRDLYLFTHSEINQKKGSHSCESRNPGRHWIPGQARNDRLLKTYVGMYRSFKF